MRAILTGILFLVCMFSAGNAFADKRIALLVGNANYSSKIGELDNPVKDLTLVRSTLMKAGFDTEDIVVVSNADRRTMLREMHQFVARAATLKADDIAFFYYSGHGAKEPGTSDLKLIPVDAMNVADTSF